MATDEADLRAAAERLADHDLGEWQGPTGDCADMRAGIVLARHVRDTLDPAPITPEGLVGLGFAGGADGVYLLLSGGQVVLRFERIVRWWAEMKDDGGRSHEWPHPLTTLGQVRRLVAAAVPG